MIKYYPNRLVNDEEQLRPLTSDTVPADGIWALRDEDLTQVCKCNVEG